MTQPESNRGAFAFPTLDDAQIDQLARCAEVSVKRHLDGDQLFAVGDRDYQFCVVQAGAIEIVDESDQTPQTVRVHGPGEFTGDTSQLSGLPSLVSAFARGDSEVYGLAPDQLRRVLNLCPNLSDIILQAFIARRQLLRESKDFAGMRVVGSRYSTDTFRIRDFLNRNRVPFAWLDLETDPQMRDMLRQFGLTPEDTPVVIHGRMQVLRNPSDRELAEAIGIRRQLAQTVYDLVIVGGGPAGLAAAVYGASEGLKTVLLERSATGGQAGTSMRIENYLGFPTGVTGSELAERAVVQANKFGAQLTVAMPVIGLHFEEGFPLLHLDTGERIGARCLLIATGADYRRLAAEGCERFEGRGVYYAATFNEAQVCRGADVVIVGGGNSAGQAAVFLAGHVKKLYLVIRGADLNKSMSSYLVQRIEHTPNIEVLRNTEVRRIDGDRSVASVEVENTETGEVKQFQVVALFSFIGATPRTDWLRGEIEADDHGFVVTGPSLVRAPGWRQAREPFLLETNRPGVFAAGDVRSKSVKRVASAVGEGAMAVQFVHAYLSER